MATFPESSPTPTYPLRMIQRWMTGRVPLGGDKAIVQKRSAIVYPAYDVVVNYSKVTGAEAQTLWNFFKARRGGYEPFYIYDLALLAGLALAHVGEFVGVGDGVETTFDIPGRSTSAQTIKVSGVTQVVTTDYTISAGTGTSSSDRVVFESGSIPSPGSVVTASFTGYLRIRVCFESDELDRELFMRNLMRYGEIKMIGQEPFA